MALLGARAEQLSYDDLLEPGGYINKELLIALTVFAAIPAASVCFAESDEQASASAGRQFDRGAIRDPGAPAVSAQGSGGKAPAAGFTASQTREGLMLEKKVPTPGGMLQPVTLIAFAAIPLILVVGLPVKVALLGGLIVATVAMALGRFRQ